MANSIIALDVGTKRVGVALADQNTKFPSPLITLINDDDIWENIADIINKQDVSRIVVGLPRSLSGDDTEQTKYCREFADKLVQLYDSPVVLQDEALTSHKAEEELRSKNKHFDKSAVDSLAATYILEDYLLSQNTGLKI